MNPPLRPVLRRMKLDLSMDVSHSGHGRQVVSLRVLLTCDDDPGSPEHAARRAEAAFAHLVLSTGFPGPGSGEEVFLEEGHIRTPRSERGLRVSKSFPVVRDAVVKLACTGAAEGSGPPREDRVDGEWLYSKRTGKWRLEKLLFADAG